MEVRDGDRRRRRRSSSSGRSQNTVLGKMFKVRKRREMLLVQVCFVCSVLFVAWSMSAVLKQTGERARGERARAEGFGQGRC